MFFKNLNISKLHGFLIIQRPHWSELTKLSYSSGKLPDNLKVITDADDPSFFRMVEYFVYNAIKKLDNSFLESFREKGVTEEKNKMDKKEGIINLIQNCGVIIEVKFPIKRDSGSYEMITGFRAHHSTHRMSLKGGIDVSAPDVNTSGREMACFMDTYIKTLDSTDINSMGCITRKPLFLGGSRGRTSATKRGVFNTSNNFIRNDKIMSKIWVTPGWIDKTYIIQGFGNVGYHTMRCFERAGANCIGVAEYNSGIGTAQAAGDPAMMTMVKRKLHKSSDTDRGSKDPSKYGIAWAKTLYIVRLVAELLVLAFRLIICSLESLCNLLLPPVEKSLANEIVLVTGTGHGIGRELCFEFVPHGCTVVCWDIDEKGNEETMRLLAKLGYTKKIHAYTCDVSNRVEVLATAQKVRRDVGEVTVLVNNAGIMPCHPLGGHKPEEIERIFDINVLAHFWTLEAFLPSMVEKNHGHVVALCSMCGVMGVPYVVPYCASKFAVRGLMESLYEEMRVSENNMRKSQVKFTTVYPTMVDTGLVKKHRTRFPALLALLPPDRVASMIVKAMRRNYTELSLPPPVLYLDRVSRLFPSKFIQHCKDFIDTGADPVD